MSIFSAGEMPGMLEVEVREAKRTNSLVGLNGFN